jgi:hypothetical protein
MSNVAFPPGDDSLGQTRFALHRFPKLPTKPLQRSLEHDCYRAGFAEPAPVREISSTEVDKGGTG